MSSGYRYPAISNKQQMLNWHIKVRVAYLAYSIKVRFSKLYKNTLFGRESEKEKTPEDHCDIDTSCNTRRRNNDTYKSGKTLDKIFY